MAFILAYIGLMLLIYRVITNYMEISDTQVKGVDVNLKKMHRNFPDVASMPEFRTQSNTEDKDQAQLRALLECEDKSDEHFTMELVKLFNKNDILSMSDEAREMNQFLARCILRIIHRAIDEKGYIHTGFIEKYHNINDFDDNGKYKDLDISDQNVLFIIRLDNCKHKDPNINDSDSLYVSLFFKWKIMGYAPQIIPACSRDVNDLYTLMYEKFAIVFKGVTGITNKSIFLPTSLDNIVVTKKRWTSISNVVIRVHYAFLNKMESLEIIDRYLMMFGIYSLWIAFVMFYGIKDLTTYLTLCPLI